MFLLFLVCFIDATNPSFERTSSGRNYRFHKGFSMLCSSLHWQNELWFDLLHHPLRFVFNTGSLQKDLQDSMGGLLIEGTSTVSSEK
jgi:hypothetical protein